MFTQTDVEVLRRLGELMFKRPYSQLDMLISFADLFDTEDEALGGVGIASKDAEAFIKDVEKLAVEKYGGATYSELADNDLDGAVSGAAAERYDRDLAERRRNADVIQVENADVRNAIPRIISLHPSEDRPEEPFDES